MQRSREQWAKIVEQFEHNGETHEAFCARLHLPVWSFRSWLYRLRRESSQGKVAHNATRLLPVRLGSSDVGQDETVVEVVVGDTVIRLCRFAESWGHLEGIFAGSWGHPVRSMMGPPARGP